MTITPETINAVSDDLARLGIVLLSATSELVVAIERQRAGMTGKGFADRFMLNSKHCGPCLLIADTPGMTDGRLLHEMGHALLWVASGRPPGHDWACYRPGPTSGSLADTRATVLGLAYAELRGVEYVEYAGGVELVPKGTRNWQCADCGADNNPIVTFCICCHGGRRSTDELRPHDHDRERELVRRLLP